MKRRHVAWTVDAFAELEEIVDRIALESPQRARRAWTRIRGAAEKLETLSSRGRVVPELSRVHVSLFRELILSPYRLIYRPDLTIVHVVAVLDARRDLEDVILERFGSE